MKCLVTNLTKYIQDFCQENYKILVNVIKELNKWWEIPCSWLWRLLIVKLSILPKLIYRFSAFPFKIPEGYFMVIDQLILKFIWRGKIPRIANRILKEKNKVRGLTLPIFKSYRKAIGWYWQNRQRDPWNKREFPDIDPQGVNCSLIRVQRQHKGGKTAFQQMLG